MYNCKSFVKDQDIIVQNEHKTDITEIEDSADQEN